MVVLYVSKQVYKKFIRMGFKNRKKPPPTKKLQKISLRPNSGHGCQESRNEMGKANLLILVFTRAAAIVLLVAEFVMHSSSIAAAL